MKRIARMGQTIIGLVGVLGALTCIGAMVLAVIGVASAGTAATMSGMSTGMQGGNGGQPAPLLAFLLQAGPVILLVSIGLFALSLAIRRWVAAIPAGLLGGVIYWGMYGQPRLPVMYITMALGLLSWALVFLWVRGHSRRRALSA